MAAIYLKEEFIQGAVVVQGEYLCSDLIYACMLIVAPVFMIVFLFRDVQVLAIRNRASWARFAGYALLLVVAVALMAGPGDARPVILHAWTRRTFASIAVLVQLVELAMGLALRRFAPAATAGSAAFFRLPRFSLFFSH